MKPNPLNFFGLREVKYQAPHFEYIEIEQQYNLEDSKRKWIEGNLKGRYHIGKTMVLDSKNQYKNQMRIGFENERELSYFMLACPHLKY